MQTNNPLTEKEKVEGFFCLHNNIILPGINAENDSRYQVSLEILWIYLKAIDTIFENFFSAEVPELKVDYATESIYDFGMKNSLYEAMKERIITKVREHLPNEIIQGNTYITFQFTDDEHYEIKNEAIPENGFVLISKSEVEKFTSEITAELSNLITKTIEKMKPDIQ